MKPGIVLSQQTRQPYHTSSSHEDKDAYHCLFDPLHTPFVHSQQQRLETSLQVFRRKSFELPKMLGGFALLEKGNKGYLFAWEDSFQIDDVESQQGISAVSQGEAVNPDGLPTHLNNDRCDRTGKNFICGGYQVLWWDRRKGDESLQMYY